MKRRALVVILLAAASLQCTAPVRGPQPPASVRLYVFDCGTLDIQDITPYQLTKIGRAHV